MFFKKYVKKKLPEELFLKAESYAR